MVERFFISFSPGFNQVSSFGSEFPEPFQRFAPQQKTQQNVRTYKVMLSWVALHGYSKDFPSAAIHVIDHA
jgi:hypothetical protein